MALLDDVKMLLGITDGSQDNLVTYIGNLVSGAAMRYCKLSVMPDDMETVLAGMVAERFRANQYGQSSTPQIVESIRDGEEELRFMKLRNAPENFILDNSLTDGEKSMLQPWRKLWP